MSFIDYLASSPVLALSTIAAIAGILYAFYLLVSLRRY
jgi:hypothetical protein